MHPLDRLRETRLLPVFIGLALVVLGLFLLRIADILPPFIWAAVTAYLLYPLVARLQRGLRIPRALAIAVTFLSLIGALTIVGVQIVPTLYSQGSSLVHSLPQLVDTARDELVRQPKIVIGGLTIDTAQVNQQIDSFTKDFASRFGREAPQLVVQTFQLLIKLLVYLLATYYFLLHGDSLIRRARELAPPRYRQTVERITNQVNATFGSYIRAQLLLFVIMSIATLIALSILQVDYALALAIATGVLEMVPVIGPWVAAIAAMLVAVSQGSAPFGWTPTQLAVVVGLVYFCLRMIEDQIVIPQLMGRIVRLHPLLVIFGILAGAALGGALGLILAVPILAALKIIVLTIVDELRHPPARRVVPLRRPGEFQRLVGSLDGFKRQQVVLLAAPGAVTWDDLATAQRLAAEALRHEVRLQMVTPDHIAASIATAAGIEVITRVRLDEEAGVLNAQTAQPEDLPARPSVEPAGSTTAPAISHASAEDGDV